MKSIAVFSVLLVAVTGNTLLLHKKFIPIRSFTHDIGKDGVYSMRSESTDGTIFSESGAMVHPAGSKEPGSSKTGAYSYTTPEGQLVTLNYVADENGFRPVGSHLPVAPPMPEHIQKMLPTLPKLVEVPETPISFVRSPMANQFLFRESAPAFVSSPQLALFQEPAPEKTLVHTSEFLIDSSPKKTMVRIGQ